MKRALSVTAVLFALCLVLSGCGKVQHAEKLIEEIGEVTIDSGPQIEATEQQLQNSMQSKRQKSKILIFLMKQSANMRKPLKSKRKMTKK